MTGEHRCAIVVSDRHDAILEFRRSVALVHQCYNTQQIVFDIVVAEYMIQLCESIHLVYADGSECKSTGDGMTTCHFEAE